MPSDEKRLAERDRASLERWYAARGARESRLQDYDRCAVFFDGRLCGEPAKNYQGKLRCAEHWGRVP